MKNNALKIATACVLCGAMTFGSAWMAGSANSQKLTDMEDAIAALNSAYDAQMGSLSSKVDDLSSATQVAELVAKLSELSASTEQIDTPALPTSPTTRWWSGS